METFLNWATELGLGALGRFLPFLIILVFGLFVVKLIASMIEAALKKSKLEKAAHSLIVSLAKAVMYILLGLIAASTLGIDVTGIVALASVVTLAISLALQNSLTNLIGGFTLLYTHPFSSGDYVEIAGQAGTVQEIGMAYTKLTTPDNKMVQIPNASVVSNDIVNYTVTGTRRIDINISASYDAPVDKVLDALKIAGDVENILPENGVFTNVTEYGDHAITYVVRVWCKSEVYWDVHKAITLKIKKVFDEQGIAMTYPHLNVHIDK